MVYRHATGVEYIHGQKYLISNDPSVWNHYPRTLPAARAPLLKEHLALCTPHRRSLTTDPDREEAAAPHRNMPAPGDPSPALPRGPHLDRAGEAGISAGPIIRPDAEEPASSTMRRRSANSRARPFPRHHRTRSALFPWAVLKRSDAT